MTVWGPVSDASPAPTDSRGEWKLTQVMRKRRISSLNPGGTSRRSDHFFLCFSTRSSDVEFGGCVWGCEQDKRGSGKREEKCTPRHGASRSRNGEQPERGRESGRGQRGVEIYSWLWAPVRVPAILSARALQGLTVAGQKHRGRPGRAAGPLVSATCREPAGGIKRD